MTEAQFDVQRDATWRTLLWWAACVTLTVLFLIHFFLIQLANLPINPLRATYRNQVEYWIHPMFTQNWSFFAPEPVSEDTDLLTRASYLDSRGVRTTTPWINVNTPLIAAVRQNRFSPLFLVEVTLANTVNVYDNNVRKDPRSVLERGGRHYFKPETPASVDPYDEGILQRYAAASLQIAFPDKKMRELQIAIMHHRFPRFNDRYTGSGDKWLAQKVAWQPFVHVAPFCCVKGGR